MHIIRRSGAPLRAAATRASVRLLRPAPCAPGRLAAASSTGGLIARSSSSTLVRPRRPGPPRPFEHIYTALQRAFTMADDEPSAAMQELRRRIVEIERDTTLSAAEKAVRRQQVMSAGFAPKAAAPAAEKAPAAADTKGACRGCSPGRAARSAKPQRAAAALSVFGCTQARAPPRRKARWP